MKLQTIELASVKTNGNCRKPDTKSDEFQTLKASIKQLGQLQPVIVMKNSDGSFKLVAGHRRYSAMKELKIDQINVIEVANSNVPAEYETIQLAENVCRKQLTPMEEAAAFSNLVQCGHTVGTVATTFAKTEAFVNQRLALAGLPKFVLKYHDQGTLDLDMLEILTGLSAEQMKTWHEDFKAGNWWATSPHQLKSWLRKQGINLNAALFPIEEYQGEIRKDLFDAEDQGMFADVDEFWKCQDKAIEELEAKHRKDGWTSVHVYRPDDGFQPYSYTQGMRHFDCQLKATHQKKVTSLQTQITKLEAKRDKLNDEAVDKETGEVNMDKSKAADDLEEQVDELFSQIQDIQENDGNYDIPDQLKADGFVAINVKSTGYVDQFLGLIGDKVKAPSTSTDEGNDEPAPVEDEPMGTKKAYAETKEVVVGMAQDVAFHMDIHHSMALSIAVMLGGTYQWGMSTNSKDPFVMPDNNALLEGRRAAARHLKRLKFSGERTSSDQIYDNYLKISKWKADDIEELFRALIARSIFDPSLELDTKPPSLITKLAKTWKGNVFDVWYPGETFLKGFKTAELVQICKKMGMPGLGNMADAKKKDIIPVVAKFSRDKKKAGYWIKKILS